MSGNIDSSPTRRGTGPQYPDGVWFVSLAAVTDAAEMVYAVADALSLLVDTGHDPVAQLIALVAAKRMLVLLDNLEQRDDVGLIADAATSRPPRRSSSMRSPAGTISVTSRTRRGRWCRWDAPLLMLGRGTRGNGTPRRWTSRSATSWPRCGPCDPSGGTDRALQTRERVWRSAHRGDSRCRAANHMAGRREDCCRSPEESAGISVTITDSTRRAHRCSSRLVSFRSGWAHR